MDIPELEARTDDILAVGAPLNFADVVDAAEQMQNLERFAVSDNETILNGGCQIRVVRTEPAQIRGLLVQLRKLHGR